MCWNEETCRPGHSAGVAADPGHGEDNAGNGKEDDGDVYEDVPDVSHHLSPVVGCGEAGHAQGPARDTEGIA